MHGDGSVQMNGAGGANAPYTENANYNQTTWACDSAGCHGNGVKFTTSTSSPLVELREFGAGTCDGCHGGGTGGANANNYWPDGSNGNLENDAKRHPLHMTKLALARYNENISDLLTNNGNGTSSAKQVELCSYCHANPGTDGDHGSPANLPAEVNTFYTHVAAEGLRQRRLGRGRRRDLRDDQLPQQQDDDEHARGSTSRGTATRRRTRRRASCATRTSRAWAMPRV